MGRCLITDKKIMATKTLEQLQNQVNELTRQIEMIETLRTIGVNKQDAEKFIVNTPRIFSGYSMGENVRVLYFSKTDNKYYSIIDENHCEAYASSCKWRPQHGYVKIVFTKKNDVKAFIKACNERNVENTWKLIKPNLSENSRICRGNIENIRIIF